MPRSVRVLLPVVGVALVLLVWWVAALAADNPVKLPTPGAVWQATMKGFGSGELTRALRLSVLRVLIGVAIGGVLAVPVGFLLAWYRPVRLMFEPLFSFFRALPPIALIPLFIAYLGVEEKTRLSILVYAAFFTSVIVVYEAVSAIDDTYIRAGRAMGANPLELFSRVVVPYTVPQVFVGLRVALGVCWATIVAAELAAAQAGLGAYISNSANYGRYADIYAGIILIGLSALVMDRLLVLLMRVTVRWQDRVAR